MLSRVALPALAVLALGVGNVFAASPVVAQPTQPCAPANMGQLIPGAGEYFLCTGIGWSKVAGDPDKKGGPCAHAGRVGYDDYVNGRLVNGGTDYTLCTTEGWVRVPHRACDDFPATFNCDGTSKVS